MSRPVLEIRSLDADTHAATFRQCTVIEAVALLAGNEAQMAPYDRELYFGLDGTAYHVDGPDEAVRELARAMRDAPGPDEVAPWMVD